MKKIQVKPADLRQSQLEKLHALEKELGGVVVAYQPEAKPAQLSEAQLTQLHQIEKELDLILVAFDLPA